MINPKYKPKSQKYYVCICQSNMLAKKKNSSTQLKYKQIVWPFIYGWVDEPTQLTTGST